MHDTGGTVARAALLAALFISLLLIGGSGCGRSCPALCDEAQAGSCTEVKGDCGRFCDAIDSLGSKAGCGSRVDAYLDCLNTGPPVCDLDCTGTEGALKICAAPYCLSNPSDPDCQTVLKSLD